MPEEPPVTCSKCKSDQLMFVAGGDRVMVACKKCMHIDNVDLTPELKRRIQAKMAPVDPWGGK